MNKTGNKVDVPFGKLLTRILEDIFFPGNFRRETHCLRFFLAWKDRLWGADGAARRDQNISQPHRSDSSLQNMICDLPGGTVQGESCLISCIVQLWFYGKSQSLARVNSILSSIWWKSPGATGAVWFSLPAVKKQRYALCLQSESMNPGTV